MSQFRFVVRKIGTNLNLDISRLINDELGDSVANCERTVRLNIHYTLR